MSGAETQSYRIWGIDGVVYGPVDLPVLVEWVQDERVTAQTWVYLEAEDRWKKAAEVAELQMFFRGASSRKEAPSYDTALIVQAPNLHPGSLRRIKAFAGLSDDDLARFVQYVEVQQVGPFTEVVRQGQAGDSMYLILQGELRVRLMIGGKETILAVVTSGDFFGEISLFDHGPRSADVVANEESVLLKLSAAAFQRLVQRAPELAAPFLLGMGKTLTSRIRADNKRYRDSVAFTQLAGV